MKATRSKEILYVDYYTRETTEETAYIFFAMDDLSEYIFALGASKQISELIILQRFKKLIKHKDFKSSPKLPFTLVSSFGGEFEKKIKSIIFPF
ncbi:hypothetical protein [Tenacibaculum sp.]|uniref:hypothetical protein n=1 Tax=Tenacibaculum sp. TaxID=1906242 RepID=UPI003AA8AD8E